IHTDKPTWTETPTHPIARLHRRARSQRIRFVLAVLCLPVWVGLASLLFIYLSSSTTLLPWLPGMRPVTIVIVPDSSRISNSYTLFAVSGKPDPQQRQVSLVQISTPSQIQSRNVIATGRNRIPATNARGQLTFVNSASSAQLIPA